MDRRQRKSRKAILSAFSRLLERKSYSRITVQEIIDEADVGRTTFYAHFPTKDDLLSELCREIFDHVLSPVLEKESDDRNKQYRTAQLDRMRDGGTSAELSILYSEMLTDIERLLDHTLNIAEALAGVQVPK